MRYFSKNKEKEKKVEGGWWYSEKNLTRKRVVKTGNVEKRGFFSANYNVVLASGGIGCVRGHVVWTERVERCCGCCWKWSKVRKCNIGSRRAYQFAGIAAWTGEEADARGKCQRHDLDEIKSFNLADDGMRRVDQQIVCFRRCWSEVILRNAMNDLLENLGLVWILN